MAPSRTSAWCRTVAAVALDSSALALARAASPSALSSASRRRSTSATTAAGVVGCGVGARGHGQGRCGINHCAIYDTRKGEGGEKAGRVHGTSWVAMARRSSSTSRVFADSFRRTSVCGAERFMVLRFKPHTATCLGCSERGRWGEKKAQQRKEGRARQFRLRQLQLPNSLAHRDLRLGGLLLHGLRERRRAGRLRRVRLMLHAPPRTASRAELTLAHTRSKGRAQAAATRNGRARARRAAAPSSRGACRGPARWPASSSGGRGSPRAPTGPPQPRRGCAQPHASAPRPRGPPAPRRGWCGRPGSC